MKKYTELEISEKTLSFFKEDTAKLIKVSRALARKGKIEEFDFLDLAIIPHIEIINSNLALVPTGCCSGHDGYPYLSIIFKDAKTRDLYLRKIRAAGLQFTVTDEYRMDTFFDSNFPEYPVYEEWNFHYRNKVIDKSALKFWKTMLVIFA